jgi:hypothetical protein
MSDVMELVQNKDGTFSAYDDTYDVVMHCETEEEQKEVIERLKATNWIPVSERLPEDGTYITTLDGELVGQEEPFTGMCGIENRKWDDEDCVIAWMPLPEPYKED